MKLTPQEMDRKIDEHFGYEGRDDVAGVLATLAPDATHDVVGWPHGPSRGREAARRFYETLFADLAESRVTPVKRLYGDAFTVDESLWEGPRPAVRSAWRAGDVRFRFACCTSSSFPPRV